MQARVSWSALEGLRDRGAGPALLGQIDNARSVSLAEPWRGIELETQDIVGGMASRVDHWVPFCRACPSALHQVPQEIGRHHQLGERQAAGGDLLDRAAD